MNRRDKRNRQGLGETLGFIAFLAASGLVGCGGAATPGPVPSSDPAGSATSAGAANFTLRDVDGTTHSLSDYLGRHVILLSFWATWCEPCKKEMHQLDSLYETHSEKGLMILSISMDEPETQGDARTFVKQRGFSFPVLLDTETEATNLYNARRAAPFNVIIDKHGQVVWTHEGYVPGDEAHLETAVLRALENQ